MKNTGNVVVVTGGASGLGEAVVRWYAARDNKVVICDLNEESGKKIEAELGENALFVKTNVTAEEDMQNAVNAAVERFGCINVLVACAGIGSGTKVVGRKGPHPLDSFKKVIDIDLIGTFNAIRLVAEQMQNNAANEDGERGVMILTSSIAASEGQIGQSAYSAAKGGVNGLVLTCAREFTTLGIRINAISPGIMATPQLMALPQPVLDGLAASIPFPSRLGKPEEFAQTVDFIVTCPIVNGTNIRIDGAMRMAAK